MGTKTRIRINQLPVPAVTFYGSLLIRTLNRRNQSSMLKEIDKMMVESKLILEMLSLILVLKWLIHTLSPRSISMILMIEPTNLNYKENANKNHSNPKPDLNLTASMLTFSTNQSKSMAKMSSSNQYICDNTRNNQNNRNSTSTNMNPNGKIPVLIKVVYMAIWPHSHHTCRTHHDRLSEEPHRRKKTVLRVWTVLWLLQRRRLLEIQVMWEDTWVVASVIISIDVSL